MTSPNSLSPTFVHINKTTNQSLHMHIVYRWTSNVWNGY